MEDTERIASVVTRLRKSKDWSQARLSRESGVPQATVSRIESGKRSGANYRTIEALARVLGAKPSDFGIEPHKLAPPSREEFAELIEKVESLERSHRIMESALQLVTDEIARAKRLASPDQNPEQGSQAAP
jgi:transcriptional regulator with XRE-family HTH domain